MFEIYYTDGVNPSTCLHTSDTLKEAKAWIQKQIKGHTLVGPDTECDEEVFESSKVASYEVYYGAPITIDDDGDEQVHAPVYESPYFYID